MKLFDNLFKDLSEMEGMPLSKIEVEPNLGRFMEDNVVLRSEGEVVYEIYNTLPENKEYTHYEILYHMRRTEDGKLQPVHSVENVFGERDIPVIPKFLCDTVYRKTRAIYNIIEKEGVLKNSNPNSDSSCIWGDCGLAVAYLDPRSKERRFFYNAEGNISKIIARNYLREYEYFKGTEVIYKTRNIYFKEGKDGLEEELLTEMSFDEKGRILAQVNRGFAPSALQIYDNDNSLSKKRVESVTTNIHDYIEEDDDHSYYLKMTNNLTHDEPSFHREIVRVEKKTNTSATIDSAFYYIRHSTLYPGKFSITVYSEKFDKGDIVNECFRYLFDGISKNDIDTFKFELRDPNFSEHKSQTLINTEKICGSHTFVKRKHYEFKAENNHSCGDIFIDIFTVSTGGISWVLNRVIIKCCTNDIKMNIDLSSVSNLKMKRDIQISAKTTEIDFQSYLGKFTERLKKIIDENHAEMAYIDFLSNCSCAENYLFDLDSITLDIDCASLTTQEFTKNLNYQFTIFSAGNSLNCTREIAVVNEEDDTRVTTILTFPERSNLDNVPHRSTHNLCLRAESENISFAMQRNIISDKSYSDILTNYIGKNTMEEIQQWEEQLKKLKKPVSELSNGQSTPQKIIPMSRSENEQS